MKGFWIEHPACQDGPVGLRRWLAWKWSEFVYHQLCRLQHYHRRIEHKALYPDTPFDDDIPF